MLRTAVKDYLTELKMRGSPQATIKNYGIYLNKFTSFVEKNGWDFSQLNPKQIKLYRNQLVQQGLKPKTVNNNISTVKSFYDYLVEEEIVKSNPVITRRLRVKEGQKLPHFLTAQELKIFNEWLLRIPLHVALGFRTMLATGMRVGEIAAITPKDIIALENGGYMIHVRHGKGNKERYVPVMDAGLARDLIRYLAGCQDDKPVFKIKAVSFISWARKCRLETGIDFHTHRCRYTVGTKLLQQGVSIDNVQEVLGHVDISTTRRYAQTAPEAIWELAAKANKVKEPRAIYRFWL